MPSSSNDSLQILNSGDFSPLLREIPDPPKQLYLKGTYPDTTLTFLTVVGSRTYSPYGRQACEKLVRGLAGYPVVIVSGLALGIDGIAHRSALAAGLITIAVPGSGLDERVLYPATHRSLAREIVNAGGALVSELDPMEKPQSWTFPKRNRIMAGLSHAVLVIEAEERSGTLITSRLATEYNRDVLAVPGPVHSSTSKGPHMLIKKGAALIESSEDIVEALHLEKKVDDRTKKSRTNLSEREQQVLVLLAEPLSRDELIRRMDMTTSEANILLSSLEIKGVISEQLGKVAAV